MTILIRVSFNGTDLQGTVSNQSISDSGRYLLFENSGAVYRDDMQTGGMVAAAFDPSVSAGVGTTFVGGDLSGDGRYASLSLHGGRRGTIFVVDFDTKTIVFEVAPTNTLIPYAPPAVPLSDDGQTVAFIGMYTLGQGMVQVATQSSNLGVPNAQASELTRNALSAAADRVAFSDNDTVYYADVAGGAPGQTQAPVAIAPGTHASISGNGRFVVFETAAALLAEDTNGVTDVYSRDLLLGTTALVSKTGAGQIGNGDSTFAAASDDGRYVVFQSAASNLVAGDTNAVVDVFRKDLLTGDILRVSVTNDGGQANGASTQAEITADGQVVTFQSVATNLVSEDGNGSQDVFRVALNGVRVVNGNEVTTSESYQLQAGEQTLRLAGTAPSFGIGNGLDNTLVGDGTANILRGLDGNDSLIGGLGLDNLNGDAGNDWLYGGGDVDVFHGGAGNDALNGGSGADTMYGGAGDDGLFGGEGNDTLVGGAGVDYLVGGNGDNALYGDAGNDSLNDGDGNGYFIGGAGEDGMYGGGGADQFFSGSGSDWMIGGNGADLFVFAPGDGADTIVDFNVLEDHINLAAVPGIDTFADVQARMSFNGTNTVIDFGGGNMITIVDVRPETLTADQFYI
jgi:Ca2+-binding RTX toxin-like protein